jgi:hypothetical protein
MNGDSLNACLALVADQRRRRLLKHLQHNGNSKVQVDDLVDRLYQAGTAEADDRQMSRDELATQLHHSHLPKLTDFGVIEHDHDCGTIEYRPDKQIEAVLNGLSEEPSLADL